MKTIMSNEIEYSWNEIIACTNNNVRKLFLSIAYIDAVSLKLAMQDVNIKSKESPEAVYDFSFNADMAEYLQNYLNWIGDKFFVGKK